MAIGRRAIRTLTLFAALAFGLLAAGEAHAWLEVCNGCGGDAYIAVARPYARGEHIVSEGWWLLKNDSCMKVIQGKRLTYWNYYIHARKVGGEKNILEDDERFCVDPAKPFSIEKAETHPCAENSPENMVWFKKIRVNKDYDNITFTIRDRTGDKKPGKSDEPKVDKTAPVEEESPVEEKSSVEDKSVADHDADGQSSGEAGAGQ
ncbi:MAG: DUF1036 domain-containing protein [Desulfatibacillaceae bacterium]